MPVLTNDTYYNAAKEIVDAYAPAAPEAVRLAAGHMLVGVMLRQGSVQSAQLDGEMITRSPRHLAMLRVSGAAEMLSQWRRPRARPIEAAPE